MGGDGDLPKSLAGFRVVSELGRGGMGVVYAAWDDKLLRRVALKLLAPHLSGNLELRERFLREARAAAALAHPNIAAVHAVEECEDGRLVLVMEHVDGGSLRSRLARRLEPGEARKVALGIAAALAKAHGVGIVHRDLKPENVVVTPEGEAKLLDFGIAKALDTGPVLGTSADLLTGTGQVVGTAGYVAPEQVEGLATDQRVDVFAFGVVLFEMLSNARPFGGETPVQRLISVVRDAPAELDAQGAEVPVALRDLVQRCLAKRPDDRPRDGAALVRELEIAWPIGAAVTPSSAPARPDLAFAPTAAHASDAPLRIAPTEVDTGARTEASTVPRASARRTRPAALIALGVLVVGLAAWAGLALRSEPTATAHAVSSASAPAPVPAPPRSVAPAPPRGSSAPAPRDGRLPPEVIQTTIRDRFPAIEKCAVKLGKRAALRSVWFVITVDGTTRGAVVRELERGYEEVDRCLVALFSTLVFPKPEGGEVTVIYPLALSDGGAELDAATCASTFSCLDEGTCSARDGRCLAASGSDCTPSRACLERGACTADRGKCRVRFTDCSAGATACADFGLCTSQGGSCKATTDEACAASTACARYGSCVAQGGVCKATAESCAASVECSSSGSCEVWQGDCTATEASCAGSRGCAHQGRCGFVAGRCAPAGDDDCARSTECRTQGRCAVGVTRRCVATRDEHCRTSDHCRERGECKHRNGMCTDE